MKLKKIIMVGIFLLAIISLGAVNAQDNLTSDIIGDQNSDDSNLISELSDEITNEVQTKGVCVDKLDASSDEIIGDVTSDDVVVSVNNTFKGCETTICVTVPEATGTVDITVGDKLYTPVFIGGVATQSISQYSIGLNNVTVNYNGIVKETNFKVLDGIVTQETFLDYYEYIEGVYVQSKESYKRYKMFDYIPEGAVLDFRGLIDITDVDYAYTYVGGLRIISSTKDAIVDGNIRFNQNYEVNNLNVTGDVRAYSNFVLKNSNVGKLTISDNRLANVTIINVNVNDITSIQLYGNGGNVSAYGSNFFGNLVLGEYEIKNFTVKNCFINGNFSAKYINTGIIENNTIINGYLDLRGCNLIVKNNIVNSSVYKYGIDITRYNKSNNTLENNVVYNYGYDYAVWVPNNSTVVNNRFFSKNFGNNAIKLQDSPDNLIIENNGPNNISLSVKTDVKKVIYDQYISITVNANAEGNVTIDVEGKKYVVGLVNGSADLNVNEYHSGTNKIAVYYEDFSNDVYGHDYTTFYVYKVKECPIELVYDNATADEFFTVNVALPDDAKGTITFTLSNDTHSITIKQDADGANNIINLLALSEGNYTMSATFESDKYVTNSTSDDISIVHVPVYKLTADNVVMDYKDGSKYKVLVTKDGVAAVGEVVNITFNGKTSNVKTDNDGHATLTLDAAPKTYTIKAEYNGIVKSSKVTIKNILKAANASKKKAKTIKFSATLKTSKGKAISGKKITFKLKGKTYTAKTNKKGVATISLKNFKVGKYTITSKYGACTVKSTLTIKK